MTADGLTIIDGDAVAGMVERLATIVVFLLAMTVTAEVAERAGVFDVAGHRVAHWGRHRAWALWVLFAGLAVVVLLVLLRRGERAAGWMTAAAAVAAGAGGYAVLDAVVRLAMA